MEKSSKKSTKKGSARASAKNGGKSDDDEDLMHRDEVSERNYGSGKWRFPRIFGRFQIFKKKSIEEELPKLRIRQEIASFSNSTFTTSGPDVTTTPSSVLTIIAPETSSTAPAESGITNIPNGGSTLQTLLSSTPPPSPAETISAVPFPSVASTSVGASLATDLPSQSGEPSTLAPAAYTTITSYIPSAPLTGNVTSSSTTSASRITSGSSVIVFSFATTTTTSGNSTSSTRSSSSSTSTSASFSSSSFVSSTFSTSFLPTSTDLTGGGAGGSAVAYPTDSSPSAASPSPTSESSESGSSGPPIQNRIIGGVLGGLAGIALVLWVILYLLRRRRRLLEIEARDEAGYGGVLGAGGGDQSMIQSSSASPFAAAAGLFARQSQQSQASETPPSQERGFYKVSGRKLPPVIGGPRPEFSSIRSGTGSSFYHHDEGVGAGIDRSATPVSSTGGAGPSRFSALTVTTTSSGPANSIAPIISPVSPMGPPGRPRIEEEKIDELDKETAPPLSIHPAFQRQLSVVSGLSVGGKDGVGRSLPSHDGSRASRFTEDIV